MKRMLSDEDVSSIYRVLKHKAHSFKHQKQYQRSLDFITYSALWAYKLNFIYTDREIDNLLKDISDEMLPKVSCNSSCIKRFVLLDTIGIDNRGLTQQYIRAFMALGVEFLYISVEYSPSQSVDILREINLYGKAKTLLCDRNNKNFLDKSEKILSEIEAYKPSKMFLHLMPWDVVALLVCSSLKDILKYNINLTDHAYWMGASFVDYNIEFRSYGMTVSLEKRKLRENQLLYLPYYPVVSRDKCPFEGFPKSLSDSLIVFSGGSYYKMFGKDDFYFKIVDALLDISDQIVLVLAGEGDVKVMNKKIDKLKHKDRVYLVGNRKDINEVFRHSDFFLDTYPLNGGLMEQFASLHSKPILAYSDFFYSFGDSQEMLNNHGNGVCSFNEIDDLIEYAKRMINDKEYRLCEGRKNNQLVPSSDSFNLSFDLLITTHENSLLWRREKIDYVGFRKLYLEVENLYTHDGTNSLLRIFRLWVFYYFPKYAPIFVIRLFRLVLKKCL